MQSGPFQLAVSAVPGAFPGIGAHREEGEGGKHEGAAEHRTVSGKHRRSGDGKKRQNGDADPLGAARGAQEALLEMMFRSGHTFVVQHQQGKGGDGHRPHQIEESPR